MHRKGLHCGSTAMGDALRLHGLDLPEDKLFGLGAGLGFSLHDGDTSLEPPQASRFFVGRSASYERDLCGIVGARLEEDHLRSSAEAWRRVEAVLRADGFPLVYTDLFHLPYVGARGHWYGHLVGIAGLRGSDALVADNEHEELQSCPIENLKAALGTGHPVRRSPTCTVLRVVSAPREVPPDVARKAVRRNALQMTEDADTGAGVRALRSLPHELISWARRPDWQRCARLCGQAIEVRGSGGGLFRRMYARFLRQSGFPALADLCVESADAFTALATALEIARASEKPDLAAAAEHAEECAGAEEALWKHALEVCG
jgi:hypothetical protein